MKHTLLALLYLCATGTIMRAQQFEHPVEYNNFLIEKQNAVMQANLDYFSKLVHSNSARKIEKRRLEVLANINTALQSFQKASYKGSGGEEMQKEAFMVITRYKQLFEVDLLEVVKLSDHCEDSYQAMELYYAAQDAAEQKLKDAAGQFDAAQQKFAEIHNIKIIETEGKNTDKIERASKVSKYQRKIYLSYFRISKDNGRLMKALEAKDVSAMQKEITALQQDVMVTLSELKAMTAFEGEDGYRQAALEAAKYLDGMANNDYKVLIAFHEKPEKSRVQKDVDAYNAVIGKMNKEGNRHINNMNTTQQKLLEKMVARKF
ncbi:MAG: hypothetical protein KF690_06775 [Bacteroidetes bacterium]|nr:hypothetical protein [Bacteroidota bacterium]